MNGKQHTAYVNFKLLLCTVYEWLVIEPVTLSNEIYFLTKLLLFYK